MNYYSGLNAALDADDTAYGGGYGDNDFEDDAPG